MSTTDLATLIEQYRTDLEAALVRLVRLQRISTEQLAFTRAGDIEGIRRESHHRDELTAQLMALDQRIREMHERLARDPSAQRLPGFTHADALYRTVNGMVREIVEIDRVAIHALEEIVAGRRAAVQDAEQAAATLAAYARMSAPRRTATLVNGKG